MSYTVRELTTEYISDRGENENKRKRLQGLMVRGLRKFNMNTSGVPKVVELEINSADYAELPCDYLQYSKIALCCNGILYSLGLNNSLCLNKQYDACGNVVAHTQNNQPNGIWNGVGWGILPTNAFAGTMRNGEFLGRMFGVGSDNNVNGYFRIDNNSRQILFSGLNRTSTVVMEYISDINSIDGNFEVHPYCIEAIFAFTRWQLDPDNLKAKADYLQEAKAMRLLFGKFTVQEWSAAIQSGNIAAPKLG